jgi:hypothetical protein
MVILPALEAQEKGCLASPYIPTVKDAVRKAEELNLIQPNEQQHSSDARPTNVLPSNAQ